MSLGNTGDIEPEVYLAAGLKSASSVDPFKNAVPLAGFSLPIPKLLMSRLE